MLIDYNIKISCSIDEYGNVIPISSNRDITDEHGNKLDMSEYPKTSDIMMIWLGERLKHPKVKPEWRE